MWEGFLTAGTPFSGTSQIAGSVAQPSMWDGIMGMAGKAGDFLTSEQGQGLLGTGFEGFNALNNYNLGKKQMNLADRNMAMQESAFNQDKINAENRRNLRF